MLVWIFILHMERTFFLLDEQRKLFHKHLNLLGQAFAWIKILFFGNLKESTMKGLFQKLSNSQYYLVVLQLDTDMQSRFQSNGWKKTDLINEAIQSFANYGIPKSRLVFKVHPLERAL